MKLVEIAQQLTPEQIKWLNNAVDGKWEYENGKVNVEGDVKITNKALTKIPVLFGYVSGSFYCSYGKLTSLAGAPREVGGSFNCSDNNLTSLAGGPKEVGGIFDCSANNLPSLAGAPREVGGSFNCHENKFKEEPDHSSIKIGGHFVWE